MLRDEEELKALMIRALEGDAAAHAALLRALVPLLRSFYRRRLPDAEDDVEDFVQETLITVHTRRETYDRDRRFTAWLYAIARHRLIDHFRRRRTAVPLDEAKLDLMVENSEEAVLAHIDVERLLATLSPKQARAIRDTQVNGLSVAEAAAHAGLGESDIKVSVHRGLRALAARFAGFKARFTGFGS
jgi:RNA polymerase sigma factor (sigma-70 family)